MRKINISCCVGSIARRFGGALRVTGLAVWWMLICLSWVPLWAGGDRIVVVVNDEVVTSADVAALKALMVGLHMVPSLSDQQAQDLLIDRYLLADQALKMGVEVTDAMVDRSIEGLAKQRQLTLDDMRQEVQKKGVDWLAYRAYVRASILQQQYAGRRFYETVNIDEADIKAYIEAHQPWEYRYVDVLIPVEDHAGSAQWSVALESAQAWQAKLSTMDSIEATDTPTLVIEVSDWLTPDHIPDLFLRTLRELDDHQVSSPIKAGNGYHVLKQIDRRQVGVPVTAEQAKTVLVDRALKKRLQTWLTDQRAEAYIIYPHA